MDPDGEIPEVRDMPGAPEPDHAWHALANVSDWIRHGDAKIGVSLAFAGAAGALLFSVLEGIERPSAVHFVLGALSAAALALSAACGMVGLVPQVRLGRRRESEDYANLVFYRHIARGWDKRIPDFVFKLGVLTSDRQELTKHLGEQVHANAVVATRKFEWADRAIKLLGVGLMFLALCAIAVVRES